jgi:hypothetical protein
MLPKRARAAAVLFILIGANPAAAQPAERLCGFSPSDWCPSPAGNPCGRHRNQQECRADPACEGLRYRGESVVACMPDGRGFWTNCPAVGCISRPPGTPRR